ncbi:MAG TPA: YceH family protein [Acidobacteriaceae bacterium]|jgi:hypothetical protein
MHLSPIEARVLGALMEKEATTPEYYPLSLNALVNACNQKNNREPLMQINEEETRLALHRLEDQKLAGPNRGHDSRVTKYEHRSQEVFNFTRAEAALICVLLLRGPQTPGELRGRTERIYRFEELDDVLAALQKLIDRDPSLVAALPRQPGTKEVRYAHLLSGPVEHAPVSFSRAVSESPNTSVADRLQHLESEVAQLRQELTQLREQLAPPAVDTVTDRTQP